MDYLEIRELYHHGIKGQKWGVRNYQNEDGSLTAEGRDRYYKANGKKKSGHRVKLEAHYMSKGADLATAEKKARNRMIVEGTLATIGVMAVTAAAVATVVKLNKEKTDQIIKEGTEDLQRVDHAKKTIFKKNMEKKNLHDVFYMTDNKFDNKNYEQAFTAGDDKLIKMKAAKDIKIASEANARKVLFEMQKDGTFVAPLSFSSDLRGNDKVPKKYVSKFLKGEKIPKSMERKIYQNFNENIVLAKKDEYGAIQRTYDEFFKRLKDKGYSGIQDLNDMKKSTLRAKNPLIIFDKSAVKITGLDTPVKSRAARQAARDAMNELIGQNLIDKYFPKVAGTAGAGLLGAATIGTIKSNVNKGSKKFVADYLSNHPDSKLTVGELKTYYKEKVKGEK